MAARAWKNGVLIGLLLAVAGCSVQLFLYWRTDAVYEELVAAQPGTRAEVEDRLAGFRGARVSEPEAMQPILREKLGSEREYWRYTRYPGFSLDVVYDADGSVFSLWPDYE